MSFEDLLQNDGGPFKFSGAEMSDSVRASRLLYEHQIQTHEPQPEYFRPATNPFIPVKISPEPAAIRPRGHQIQTREAPASAPYLVPATPVPGESWKTGPEPAFKPPREHQPTEHPKSVTDFETRPEYVFLTHTADVLAIAAGVTSTYISAYITMNRALPHAAPEHSLSQQSVSQLRNSITEMRLNLIQSVVIPAEQGMTRLGWQVGEPWITPRNRHLLAYNGQIFGKEGLPRDSDLWRDRHGRLFAAPNSFNQTKTVFRSELNTALENGALNPREASLVRNLRQAEQELVRLTALDAALDRNVHRLSMFPNANESVFRTQNGFNLQNRHNTLLDAARRELTAAELADRQAISNARRGFGTMLAAHVAGKVIDREFFEGTPISFRTGAIDYVSSSIVLSRLHWAGKGAVILGAHVASRLLDYRMNSFE